MKWSAQRRQMYDREVDVPRLTSHFRLVPPEDGIPPAILQAAEHVVAGRASPSTASGLNFYRDGRTAWLPTTTT